MSNPLEKHTVCICVSESSATEKKHFGGVCYDNQRLKKRAINCFFWYNLLILKQAKRITGGEIVRHEIFMDYMVMSKVQSH